MPKGGGSKTPQSEDFPVTDMVEKQSGKKFPLLPYGTVILHAGNGIVHHQTVLGWLGEVALGRCFGTILYSWLCF
uniref:Uncharacterized protein n=1 Tax=Erpetoichthys calabaricus TaxID=27687 RepID=A0A8C4SKH4_ERPCA